LNDPIEAAMVDELFALAEGNAAEEPWGEVTVAVRPPSDLTSTPPSREAPSREADTETGISNRPARRPLSSHPSFVTALRPRVWPRLVLVTMAVAAAVVVLLRTH
jgi:hypothetical protein